MGCQIWTRAFNGKPKVFVPGQSCYGSYSLLGPNFKQHKV